MKYSYTIWEEVLKELAEGHEPDQQQLALLTEEERTLLQELKQKGMMKEAVTFLGTLNEDKAWSGIQPMLESTPEMKQVPVRRMGRSWRIAAAVLIPLVLAGGMYLWFTGGNTASNPKPAIAEVKPVDHKRATLILEDGKSIDLKKHADSTLVSKNGLQVTNEDSTTLRYSANTKAAGELVYNKLVVPRGGEYRLVLADGTEVWMNAASTLRFPVQFGSSREVYLESGEAYFKVAKNTARPFIVHVNNNDEVRVLGTSFNVNTYTKNVQTTLVEGKVLVKSGNDAEELTPGQQAVWSKSGGAIRKEEVDVMPFIAWKEGWMIFDESRLEEVMEQLGRWYDYDIQFSNEQLKNVHFGGKLRRYQHINEVLSIIERTQTASCTIKNRTIIVNPSNGH